jgi:hypothetical protein
VAIAVRIKARLGMDLNQISIPIKMSKIIRKCRPLVHAIGTSLWLMNCAYGPQNISPSTSNTKPQQASPNELSRSRADSPPDASSMPEKKRNFNPSMSLVRGMIQQCFQRELNHNGRAYGTADCRITVTKEGKATKAQCDLKGTLSLFKDCAEQALLQNEYPQGTSLETFSVRFRLSNDAKTEPRSN